LRVREQTIHPIQQAEPERSGGWGAEAPYGRLYDPAKARTVHGTVVHAGTGPPMPVHIGPEWYLEHQDLDRHEHEVVQVTGTLAEVEGQVVFLAQAVTVNGRTLLLRDAQGQPLWSALRRSGAIP